MEKKSFFQTMLVVVFLGLFVVALISFMAIKPKSKAQKSGLSGNVTVWGSLSAEIMTPAFDAVKGDNQDLSILYTYVEPAAFEKRFVEALASGSAPDLIIIDEQEILRQYNRLQVLPYDVVPPQEFFAQYAPSSAAFVLPWGVAAIPFAIDPLVVYYNNDMLASAYIVSPATTWQELDKQIQSLTQIDQVGVITQSAISLGSANNIPHMVSIILSLAMQTGGSLVNYNGEAFISSFQAGSAVSDTPPFIGAFSHYLTFSDPTTGRYTWNTGMPPAFDAFIAARTAYYIGFASEYESIRSSNPNLNFGVSQFFQIEGAQTKSVAARLYGTAITRTSANPTAALYVAQMLADPNISQYLSAQLLMAPAHKQLLQTIPSDTRGKVVFQSAIIAKSWWVPGTVEIREVFSRVINNTQSGIATLFDALSESSDQFDVYLKAVVPPPSAVVDETGLGM
jgi:ABC-type glycerol-3-phosphate transport system substrate-binding protein